MKVVESIWTGSRDSPLQLGHPSRYSRTEWTPEVPVANKGNYEVEFKRNKQRIEAINCLGLAG